MRPARAISDCSASEGIVEDAIDDPATAALEPGTITFAFGRRAYYLYWKRPDGRIGWGANLPSPQYLSLKEARAVPAEDWLHTLRTTYANDVPGARLTAETTSETLQAVGGLHISAAGSTLASWSHGARRRCRARTVQQHRAGRLARDGERDPAGLAACATCPMRGRRLPPTSACARPRVEKIAARGARISHAKAPGPIALRLMRVLLPVMVATMNIEQTMAAEQRYTIDWDAPAQEDAKALA